MSFRWFDVKFHDKNSYKSCILLVRINRIPIKFNEKEIKNIEHTLTYKN